VISTCFCKRMLICEKYEVKVVNRVHSGLFSNKRPRGCRSLKINIRKVRWLMQLKVAIATQATVPNKQSPQNS
jgi:hypothetical protein